MNKPALIIFCCLALALLLFRFWSTYHKTSNYTNGQTVSFVTTITTTARVSGNFQKITVHPDPSTAMFITLPRDIELDYGKTVRISGTSLRSVLSNKKTILTMYLPKVEAVKRSNNLSDRLIQIPLVASGFVRTQVGLVFMKALPADLASLLLGIVLGVKGNMSSGFSQTLSRAGVTHVIAASGMNVVVVGGFLASLFTFFFRRQHALIFTIFGILFYAFLAGMEPSIIRASIMGILVLASQIIGRQYLASYGLGLAVYFMLFIQPVLIADIGFQLSVTATAGLLYIKPLFDRFMPKIPFIGEDLTTTLSAQVATLPILLTTFGSYSLGSILANLLVLWTVPILMAIGAAAAALTFFFQPLAILITYLSLPFLMYFEKVVYVLSGLPALHIDSLPFISIVGYYLFVIALMVGFQKKPE